MKGNARQKDRGPASRQIGGFSLPPETASELKLEAARLGRRPRGDSDSRLLHILAGGYPERERCFMQCPS